MKYWVAINPDTTARTLPTGVIPEMFVYESYDSYSEANKVVGKSNKRQMEIEHRDSESHLRKRYFVVSDEELERARRAGCIIA